MSTRPYNSKTFEYTQNFQEVDFRIHPERYQIGRGEQGVLLVEPYKSEILPHWRFRTPEVAHESSAAIYKLFLSYKRKKDFVGMDMARKFLQMGYTRARRYANHASGRKYETNPQKEPSTAGERVARSRIRPQQEDWGTNEKAQAARIFYRVYQQAREDPVYMQMRKQWQKKQTSTNPRD